MADSAASAYSTAPFSGQYAQIQAQAEQAYQQALANIASQRASLLQQYGYSSDGSIDPSNPYGLYQQGQRQYQEQDAQLKAAANESQLVSGLNATFGSDGNPTGQLDLRADNPYGGYQTILSNEGLSLNAARDDALNRGLGTKGAGAQGVQSLLYGQAGERQSYRQQLVDTLTQNAQAQKDNLYNFNLGLYNLGNALTGGLSGLDSDAYGAKVTRDQTDSAAEAKAIADAIANGQLPTATSGGLPTTRTNSKAGTSTGSMVAAKPGQTLAQAEAAALAKVGLGKPKAPTPASTKNAYNTNTNKRG